MSRYIHNMSTERLEELLKGVRVGIHGGKGHMDHRQSVSEDMDRDRLLRWRYSRKTGIPRKITKAEALDIALDRTVKATLAEPKKAVEEG